jgi:hypothetical protein
MTEEHEQPDVETKARAAIACARTEPIRDYEAVADALREHEKAVLEHAAKEITDLKVENSFPGYQEDSTYNGCITDVVNKFREMAAEARQGNEEDHDDGS